MQATFKIKLDVPTKLVALSNMPVVDEKINGDFKTVCFEESPLMSTYVVAFVVGLYDYIEETTTGGACFGKIHTSLEALSFPSMY